MGRIIIFTGKGGVGKTSVAAAHARKSGLLGKKTLLVSADMAHNLSDLFELTIGKEETYIAENLYGLELDPAYEMEHNFSFMMKAINNLMPSPKTGFDSGEDLEDLVMFPGMEELFSLMRIKQIYESNKYEVIIVDCAPTGETLALLKFPELLSWYMEKLFPIGKVAMKVLRPVSKKLFKLDLPDGKAMNDIEKLYLMLASLQTLIKNKDITSIRLVAIPEKMVVEETKRSYMYLNLYNYNVDGLFINRILPSDMDADYFNLWLLLQAGYIEELEYIFGEIPIHHIKWYDTDINGLAGINQMTEEILKDDTILEVKIIKPNEIFEKNQEGYLLTVNLPCVSKEALTVHESGNDVILRIGNYKRNIPIPNILRKYYVGSAKLSEQVLKVQFIPQAGGESSEL